MTEAEAIKVLINLLKRIESSDDFIATSTEMIPALKIALNVLTTNTFNALHEIKKIREEITRFTSRYSLAKERGGTGQVEWSDYIIKESDVLAILDKRITELEGENE